ncbi:MAG: RNA methyltransferase [Tannerella sp.]|jgi:tRNA G18 (ribose-2'-O)-methylase SpoU|nr:RNA methyltransferase [Tannerella sp.]
MRKLKITELNRLTPAQYRMSRKQPLVVVLDHVRSLNNVGSVFRTADAFRLEAVYLCGLTATPPHPEIHKTALGAEETTEWRYFADTRDAVHSLKEAGYTICALEQAEGSIPLDVFMPENEKKYAIILGHEVKGVQQEIVDLCDCCIEIPQFGTKHSLNVAVAAGIVIWEISRNIPLEIQ